MQCKTCGANLVRGFTFCFECGEPIQADMLEQIEPSSENIDNVTVNNKSEEKTGDVEPYLQRLSAEASGADLKPQYQGGTDDGGKNIKPRLIGSSGETAGKALEVEYIGGADEAGMGDKVRANVFELSSDSDSAEERLVFCANCGMHMQHDAYKCEICGMILREGSRQADPE